MRLATLVIRMAWPLQLERRGLAQIVSDGSESNKGRIVGSMTTMEDIRERSADHAALRSSTAVLIRPGSARWPLHGETA